MKDTLKKDFRIHSLLNICNLLEMEPEKKKSKKLKKKKKKEPSLPLGEPLKE